MNRELLLTPLISPLIIAFPRAQLFQERMGIAASTVTKRQPLPRSSWKRVEA